MILQTEWVVHDCLRCKALFAIPTAVDDRLQETHVTFYCPYCGNSHHYPQLSDKEKLAQEKRALQQRLRGCEIAIEEKDYQIKVHDGRARAYKGLYRKTKELAAGGNGGTP